MKNIKSHRFQKRGLNLSQVLDVFLLRGVNTFRVSAAVWSEAGPPELIEDVLRVALGDAKGVVLGQ